MYNWQNPQWPHFSYNLKEPTYHLLYLYALENGKFMSLLNDIEKDYQTEILLEIMVLEAQKTSEIEGEILLEEEIRSSLKKQLGLFQDTQKIDERTEGITALLLHAQKTFLEPLTEQCLHHWHTLVMQGSNLSVDKIGKFRTDQEPMQIVSGPIGREKVYFEAPPSKYVLGEMARFITWFNTPLTISSPIKAAISHLYFESIHPYPDGNGRIGRALSEKILSKDLKIPMLFSLSDILMKNRKRYYQELHTNSQESLEITEWICFFINMIVKAQEHTKEQVRFIIQKAKFWKKYEKNINPRQEKALKRMFQEGIKGFIGGMSARKYMKITETSKATATRDLSDLVEKKCLRKLPGDGRNTCYELWL